MNILANQKGAVMAECASENLKSSDIESFFDAMPEYLEQLSCPSCNSSDESTRHRVEGITNVMFCSSCDRSYGIDDSMDVDDLRQLMEEGRVKTSSCVCGNDDIEAFVITECPQSGELLLECMNCKLRRELEMIPTEMLEAVSEETDDSTVHNDNASSSVFHTFDDQNLAHHHQPFTCECGNDESELFEKVFDAREDCLVSVKCWNCDRETKLRTVEENYCPIECGECGNNLADLFDTASDESGTVLSIYCHACKKHLQLTKSMKVNQQASNSESGEPPLFVSYEKTRVTSLRTLKRGDHVAWKRLVGIYSHHGIVVEVLSESKLEVIHNTVAEGGKADNGGANCKILRGIVDVDLSKGDLYLCNYKQDEYLEPDETIARAESLLDVKNYNLFLSNCEHFATLCKTGRRFSEQVSSLVDVVRGISCAAVKEAEEGALVAIASKVEKLARDKVMRCSIKGALRRFTGTASTRGLKALSIGGAVAINLAVEGIVFGVKTKRARKEYKNGEISLKQFHAKTADAGCSSGIRFACSSTGGLIGQLVIPVPFLGGFVGCTVGAVIGHIAGNKVGKHCANKILR